MRKKRILIVEDMGIVREPIALALEGLGYRVVQAASGPEALKILTASVTPFDLLLLDYQMPVMSGIAFLKIIRADPDLASLPVVMLTATADKKVVIEASKLGVSNYVLKSTFDVQELVKTIKKTLAPFEREDEVDSEQAKTSQPASAQAPGADLETLLEQISRAQTMSALTEFAHAKTQSEVVAEIVTVMSTPGATAAQMARVIQNDPSLSASIIRAAASTAQGSSVTELEAAVEALGFDYVRALAIGIGFFDIRENQQTGIEEVKGWQRCFANARIMEHLFAGAMNSGASYLMGLAHGLVDVGLRAAFPKQFSSAAKFSLKHERPMYDVVPDVFGASAVDLLEHSLNELRLPASVRTGIEEYFQASAGGDIKRSERIAAALRFAEHYSSALLVGDGLTAPFTAVDSNCISGNSIPALDGADLRQNVIETTMRLAALTPEQGRTLTTPLFPRVKNKIYYIRSAEFIDPDPVGLALASLVEFELLDHLPKSDKELESCKGIIMASMDPSGRAAALTAYKALIESGANAKKLPVLHISPAIPANLPGAKQGIEWAKYPLPVSRMAKFVSGL